MGLNWQPASVSGWGLIALNMAYHMVLSGRASPRFVAPVDGNLISLPKPWGKTLRPSLKASSGFAGAGQEPGMQVDFPLLKAAGQDFLALPERSSVASHAMAVLELTRFDAETKARVDRLDKIVVCATWLADWLRGEGVDVAGVVHHGIDHDLFRTRREPPEDDSVFRVFSGGKLEYRKGQDLTIAAFKRFHANHPEARLCVAWTNLFGGGPGDFTAAGHVSAPPEAYAGREGDITGWIVANGVPAEAVENVGLYGNALLPDLLDHCHVALFPNRAEGSTNMVAMECLAAGVPTILSANTGHLDLIDGDNCYALGHQRTVDWRPEGGGTEHWGESDVDEIVAALETAYQERDDAHARGQAGAAKMAPLTWESQTDAYLDALNWPAVG